VPAARALSGAAAALASGWHTSQGAHMRAVRRAIIARGGRVRSILPRCFLSSRSFQITTLWSVRSAVRTHQAEGAASGSGSPVCRLAPPLAPAARSRRFITRVCASLSAFSSTAPAGQMSREATSLKADLCLLRAGRRYMSASTANATRRESKTRRESTHPVAAAMWFRTTV